MGALPETQKNAPARRPSAFLRQECRFHREILSEKCIDFIKKKSENREYYTGVLCERNYTQK